MGCGNLSPLYHPCVVLWPISEDVIMGFNNILPLQGGLSSDDAGKFFRLSTSLTAGSPTVNIPLAGQTEATSVTHRKLERGPLGPSIKTFLTELRPPGPGPGEEPDTDIQRGPPVVLDGRSTAKEREEAILLLHYAKGNPLMVS